VSSAYGLQRKKKKKHYKKKKNNKQQENKRVKALNEAKIFSGLNKRSWIGTGRG